MAAVSPGPRERRSLMAKWLVLLWCALAWWLVFGLVWWHAGVVVLAAVLWVRWKRRGVDSLPVVKSRVPGRGRIRSVVANLPVPDATARRRVLGPVVSLREVVKPSYEGVTAIIGEPGSGKTYLCAEAALLQAARGWRVYTNGMDIVSCETPIPAARLGINPESKRIREDGTVLGFRSFHEFLRLCEMLRAEREAGFQGGVLIIIDEAGVWLPAAEWRAIPGEMLVEFLQCRKSGLVLLYTTQDFRMVVTGLRRITFWAVTCTRNGAGQFVRQVRPNPEWTKPSERPRKTWRVWARQGVYDAYSSVDVLEVPADAAWRGREERRHAERQAAEAHVAKLEAEDGPFTDRERELMVSRVLEARRLARRAAESAGESEGAA